MDSGLLGELVDWLAIPSISTGGGDPEAIELAAQWVVDRIQAAGGEASLVHIDGGNPLAVGQLRASVPDAPTVLIYGHYDVQGPGSSDGWTSPAFEPTIRAGRIYARGASDDKGNFLPLLHVACSMARAGELPVHVRVLVEGEEECAGQAVTEWVRRDVRGADVAIVFDSGMPDAETPTLTIGLRGVVMAQVEVRTAQHNVHSGVYGGAVLNANHVLHHALAQVMPGPDGRVREELSVGTWAPSTAELEAWRDLPPGAQMIAQGGVQPVQPAAAREFYERTGAAPALDVNEIAGGEPRTVVPGSARATVSLRLAPGQDVGRMASVLETLMTSSLPAGAELDMSAILAQPVLFEPDEPALVLAAGALERACGQAPALARSGGTIPVVAEMAARGYPVIVGGFSLPADAGHSVNESYALTSLAWGVAAARELYVALASLPAAAPS